MSGKGDSPRPVDRQRFEAEYDRIFRRRSLREIQAEGRRMWNERIAEYDRLPRAKG